KKTKMNDGSAQDSVERSKSVFVGNLPFSMTKEWLEQIFSWCGDIERVSLPTDWESGKIKGFAFLDFADEDSAEKAVGKNGEDCEGRDLRINYSFPKNDHGGKGKGKGGKGKGKGHHELGEKSASVFVGNLPWSMTQDWLYEVFGDCGSITRCFMPTDRETGNPRGFAYIDFDSEDSAEKATKLSGTDLEGRQIRVNYNQPRESSGKGGKGKGKGGKGKGGKGKGKGKGK
ncbi:hypothetical protein FOZ63_018225, partial [Perkinsus olseni]